MTTNFNLTNADAAVKISGRIVKNGYRFHPASGGRQPVANVKVEFRRAWDANHGQGGADWKDIKSILDFDLWGQNAERLDSAMQGLDGKKIIVEVSFNAADLKAKIWGDNNDKVDLVCRANGIRIINVGEYRSEGGESQFVQAPETDDVPAEAAVEVEL